LLRWQLGCFIISAQQKIIKTNQKEVKFILNENEKKFVAALKEAEKCVKGELELDYEFENGEWFARDYRGDLEGAFSIEAEQYNEPIITDKEAKEKGIDIIKCCDACDIAYVA
jgi:hypothetical protein